MVEIERLKPSEFHLLARLGDGYTPHPTRSVVVVAKNKLGLIGRCCLVSPAHVEGVYIDPLYRSSMVMKKLVDATEDEARAEGVNKLLVFAHGEEMESYIGRLGYSKMPLTVWEKNLCQPR